MVVASIGILLVATVLLDVFLTVLDADGRSLVSGRTYRWFWYSWRHFARLLPRGTEHITLSLGAPLMIPLVIAVWLIGLVTGFALLYFGGFSFDETVTGGGSQPSLSNAFRLSWVTLSTIGFVEISPSSMPYSMAVALEAILGGIVITLTITYYLNVHQVVRDFNEFVAFVRHNTAHSENAFASLAPAFEDGRFTGEAFVSALHTRVTALHEGLRRYPIVYYFRSAQHERGLPYALARLRQITTGLEYAAPEACAPSRSMALRALRRALVGLVEDLEARYVPVTQRTVARPASPSAFAATAGGRPWASDIWVERFLNECSVADEVTGCEAPRALVSSYERYRAWLPFVVRLRDFETAVADDLGYTQRFRPGRSSAFWSILAQGPKDIPQPLLMRREDK